MDVSLQLHSAVCSKNIYTGKAHLNIKPFCGFFPLRRTSRYSRCLLRQSDYSVTGSSYQINASSDFSRKLQRKFSTSRFRGSAPKGFMPHTQVGTSRSQKNNEEKEGSSTPISTEFHGLGKKKIETKFETDEKNELEIPLSMKGDEYGKSDIDGITQEASNAKPLGIPRMSEFIEEQRNGTVELNVLESHEVNTNLKIDAGDSPGAIVAGKDSDSTQSSASIQDRCIDIMPLKIAGAKHDVEYTKAEKDLDEKLIEDDDTKQSKKSEIDEPEKVKTYSEHDIRDVVGRTGLETKHLDTNVGEMSQIGSIEIDEDTAQNQFLKSESVQSIDKLVNEEKENDSSPKLVNEEKGKEVYSLKFDEKLIEDDDTQQSKKSEIDEPEKVKMDSEHDIRDVVGRTGLETKHLDTNVGEMSQIGSIEIDENTAQNQFLKSESVQNIDKLVNEEKEKDTYQKLVNEEKGKEVSSLKFDEKLIEDDDTQQSKKSEIDEPEKVKTDSGHDISDVVDRTGLETKPLDTNVGEMSQIGSIEINEDTAQNQFLKSESVQNIDKLVNEEKENVTSPKLVNEEKGKEVSSLKLEMEENFRRQVLEKLTQKNLSEGNKLFYYPEVVKPNQVIEVFLNRSLSTLNNEPDVMIMGAFNDWRWKSFNLKMNKTHLIGDWWSCRIHVPKEAYKIDFVFFNGKDVYDNNDQKDFCITVEGGMDVFEFEDFFLEEKKRDLEKLAKEQAEKERHAAEQRRIEAEKASSVADRAQAREEAAKRRGMLHELMKRALKSAENVWFIEPSEFKSEDKVRLYYKRSSGPLAHSKDLWIHGGNNNWKDGLSIVARLVKSERKDGDWWYAEVVVPDRAFVLDWVFADGPPQHANLYDNNNRHDFHAIVPKCMPEELYWVQEEHMIYKKLQEERRLREEAIRAKAEKTACMKAETRERTLKTFLLSQKHIVYTDPLDVHAGSTVTVLYNPANTVLNGKPEIWFKCSFNRWTHRMGPLPPQKMLPAENGSHVKASLKVPLDAYMMDFVFSESEDGGIYDNKNGMDYHIPVFGGIAKEPPIHIVHIAVEMAPIAKVGGLGDVVTSLSRAVQDLKHNVDIILPKYDCLNLSNVNDFHFHKSYSWGGTEIKVWYGKVEGLSVYFLEPQNGFFRTGCLYNGKNDAERFSFFCHAALEFLFQSGFHPDIIHCHDWSSAPVAWLFKDYSMHYGLSKARIVFTIHNLEFGAHFIEKAMACADKATTVSPTYSREVARNPAVAPHLYKFHGILNGIDPDIWDPYNDKFIPVAYTCDNVVEGKRAAKEALQQRLGLKRFDLPLVGIITRLTHQKGIHLIKHAIWRTLDRGGQVVLLGSAPDHRIQNDFVNLSNQLHSSHNDRARLCLTYDEQLSHLIYAGADFILVPSIFEPCGLTQLIALRYGSIPVVRKTGGLYDTVFDVDHDKDRAQAQGLEPNGFSFDGVDASGVDYALNRAISSWYDGRDWFNSLCKKVMEQDWSWNRPALDYLELYHSARK